MKTLTKLLVPLLLGTLVACGDPDAGPVTVTPGSVTVKAGDTTTLIASVEGSLNPRIIWSVEGGKTSGTITSAGIYTAPATEGTYTVVATNAVDTTKKASATVTVTPAVVVTVQSETPVVAADGSATFTANVTGATNTAVKWSIQEGADGGSITSAGVYTAPTQPGTYTIVATSAADPNRKGTFQVKVEAVTVKATPETETLDQGATLTLGADVTGTPTKAVTWSVEGTHSGTITSGGVYTAPHKAGTYTLVATSVADPRKKATATITVRDVAVAIAQGDQTTSTAGSVNFTATVTGTTGNTAVTWSVEGTNSGTITSAGVYKAPTAAGTFTVVATSVADTTKKATAKVKVDAVVVKPTLATQTLDQGASLPLTADVTGTTNTAVTWTVAGTNSGTISSAAVYTAPFVAGTYTLTATSAADSSKKATATITVRPVVVTLTPGVVTLNSGGTHSFTAAVTGTTRTTDVTWSVGGGSGRGSVTSSGVYTAPAAAGRFTVIATSVADPTKTGTATITVPTATTGFKYEDPTSTGWRLVKNAALSTDSRLVLDLFGPAGQSARGVDLAISTDSRAPWAKLASGDSEYALNQAFDLGSGPQLFRSGLKGNVMSVGVFQKGTGPDAASPAVSLDNKPLLTVGMNLTSLGPTVGKGPVAFQVLKAHALSDGGALETINVAVGTLTLG